MCDVRAGAQPEDGGEGERKKTDQYGSSVRAHEVPEAVRANHKILVLLAQLAVRHSGVGNHKLLELLIFAHLSVCPSLTAPRKALP